MPSNIKMTAKTFKTNNWFEALKRIKFLQEFQDSDLVCQLYGWNVSKIDIKICMEFALPLMDFWEIYCYRNKKKLGDFPTYLLGYFVIQMFEYMLELRATKWRLISNFGTPYFRHCEISINNEGNIKLYNAETENENCLSNINGFKRLIIETIFDYHISSKHV